MVLDLEQVKETIKTLKETAKKRNFTQSVDLNLMIKDLDLKQPANQVEFVIHLANAPKKKKTVCAFVDHGMAEQIKGQVDEVIVDTDFSNYAGKKKECKKLADSYDFFISQANLMAKVASTFGRFLGPRKKMPNPKIGGVITGKTDIPTLVDTLQKTVIFSLKKGPSVHMKVGDTELSDEEIAKNVKVVYDTAVHNLPSHDNNLKSAYLKLTMSEAKQLKI